jgi:hypothetical protein
VSDSENPTIPCTVKQLAFVAWQESRGGPIDLNPIGDSFDQFDEWWKSEVATGDFATIKDATAKAWMTAQRRRYSAWWQTIVDGQPTATNG